MLSFHPLSLACRNTLSQKFYTLVHNPTAMLSFLFGLKNI
jgi:hypothetical protein